MNDQITRKTVRTFALENKSNLETALAVADAVPTIKHEIASDFLRRMKLKLSKALGKNWSFTEDIPRVFDQGGTDFSMWKRNWEDRYAIALGFWNHGSKVVVGICRWREEKGRKPNPKIHELFEKEKWSGKSSSWYEWYSSVQFEYENWNRSEALVKMQFQTDRTIDYFSAQMLRVARLAEPLIDRMCKR
jgi:hypothetical protein